MVVIRAAEKQIKIEIYEAYFANDNFPSPTRFPILVAEARPIESGSIKKTLAILIAIV